MEEENKATKSKIYKKKWIQNINNSIYIKIMINKKYKSNTKKKCFSGKKMLYSYVFLDQLHLKCAVNCQTFLKTLKLKRKLGIFFFSHS